MALSPIVNLPVRWQVLAVDVESIVPHRGFAAEAYDVANVNGILMVESPIEQDVTLVVPFPTERASAGVRVVSTDKATQFKKEGRPKEFEQFLKQIGEIPADQEPMLKTLREETRDFRVAEIHVPAGSQVLRFYARQQLRPKSDDARAFEVVFFAPLAGFILSPGGQTNMAVTVAFPPSWAAPGLTAGQPVVTPLPGQPDPTIQSSGTVSAAERQIFGWLWRNDPKVTIPYRYN
jgi:hypothetical protein